MNFEWCSTREALIELESLFKCSLCKELYKDPVTVGSCDHHFCRSCLDSVTNSVCVCPECKKPIWNCDVKASRAFSSTLLLCNRLRQLIGMVPQKATTQRAENPASTRVSQQKEGDSLFRKPLLPMPTQIPRSVDGKKQKQNFRVVERQKQTLCEDNRTEKKMESTTLAGHSGCPPLSPIPLRTRSRLKRRKQTGDQRHFADLKCGKLLLDANSETSDESETDTNSVCTEIESEDNIIAVVEESDASEMSPSINFISESASSKATTSRLRRGKRRCTDGDQRKIWRNRKGETLLHVACIKGQCGEVESLLRDGADPNMKDNAGWTPLHEACNHGYSDVARVLLDAGAVVNMPGFDNETPLHDAVANGHLDIVKLLLSRGASTVSRNCDGLTPQAYAASPTVSALLMDSKVCVSSRTPATSHLPSPKASAHGVCSLSAVVLLATGLNDEQKSQLKKLANRLNAKVQQEFCSLVTHIVTSCNEDNCCPRTLKCLFGILSGKWIVGFDWVTSSLKYGNWQDEETYEVADVVGISSSAPQKGRQNAANKLPRLFDGCYFYFFGGFHSPMPSRDELVKLVQCAGGRLLQREPKPLDEWQATVPYHKHDSQTCTRYIVYDQKSNQRPCHVRSSTVAVVPCLWLIDCIMKFELLPVTGL